MATAMSPDDVFNTIVNTLTQGAIKAGMDQSQLPYFLRAALGIVANESGFHNIAHNLNPATRDDSWGPWQINRHPQANPNVDPEKAQDPVWSTQWRLPGLLSVWMGRDNGQSSVARMQQDPAGFLSVFHQTVQSSAPVSLDRTSSALGLVNSMFSGKQNATAAIAQYDPTGKGPGIEYPGGTGATQPGFQTQGDNPYFTQRANDPPPATTFDGIMGVILDRVSKGAVSTNPDEQRTAATLLEQIPNLRDAFGQVDPTKAYELAQTIGIRRDEIDAQIKNQNEERRWKAEQNDLDRSASRYGQELSFTSASNQLAEDRRYHDQLYGISLGDLGLRSRQLDQEDAHFAQQMGVSRDELDLRRYLGQSDVDIRNKQLGLQEQETFGNLEIGRGNLGVSQGRLALDTQTAQEANQLARETLDFNKQQALVSGARSDRQAAMSGLTDILRTQVAAGQMSEGMAEHALDALVKTWQEAPSTSGYLEGWEPGGVYSAALSQIGGRYEPSNYRVRPFPINLESLVNSGSKFDLSQAWQNAVSLMRGEGMMPQGMGNQQWPSATSGTPTTAAVAPTAASASPVSPTPAPPMTQTSPSPSPPPSSMGAPMNSQPGAPSSTPPAQPQINPPATPQRTHWAWNGSTWTQVPDPQ